jgi:major type 1 subunit fimbrin (pilin)
MSLLISAQALAADNTVTFLGEVTSETCTVAINGNKVSPVVLLPSVNKSELLTAGSVAKPTTFDISVSGCTGNPAQPTTISSKFAGNSITVGGNLGNVATGTTAATNAEIQILDTAAAPINFTTPFTASGDLTLPIGSSNLPLRPTPRSISAKPALPPQARYRPRCSTRLATTNQALKQGFNIS